MARPPQRLEGLALARTALDRRGDLRSRPGLLAALLADQRTRVLELVGDSAPVVGGDDASPRLHLRAPAGDEPERALFLGMGEGDDGEGETAYVSLVREDGPLTPLPDGAELRTLRQVGAQLADRDAGAFTTALAVANWHRSHRFCPRCGEPTVPDMAGWIRRCPADGSEHYPRTDPAVIMSVIDDEDRLLLAHGRAFRASGMSVLAGFVEPGESLADAVVREVAEEVGVTVTDVTYLGDQPWPFPASLMVGFTARALGTELVLQDEEIDVARWFTRDELVAAIADETVRIPPRLSIARRLIEHWFGGPIDAPEVILRGR